MVDEDKQLARNLNERYLQLPFPGGPGRPFPGGPGGPFPEWPGGPFPEWPRDHFLQVVLGIVSWGGGLFGQLGANPPRKFGER